MKIYYCNEYCSATHAWDTTRKAALVAEKLRDKPDIEICRPEPLSRQQLLLAHSENYIEAVLT
ncbi:MAG: hypothetical protein ACKO0V_12025, partial [bacterium]